MRAHDDIDGVPSSDVKRCAAHMLESWMMFMRQQTLTVCPKDRPLCWYADAIFGGAPFCALPRVGFNLSNWLETGCCRRDNSWGHYLQHAAERPGRTYRSPSCWRSALKLYGFQSLSSKRESGCEPRVDCPLFNRQNGIALGPVNFRHEPNRMHMQLRMAVAAQSPWLAGCKAASSSGGCGTRVGLLSAHQEPPGCR